MLIKACLNGARRPAEHPALPVEPAQLAADAAAVAAEGAGAVHLHVKDPFGDDTFDAAALAEVLQQVRPAASGLPIGVTTGAWALPGVADRVDAIRRWELLPDFASVNWHEEGADAVAAMLIERGVGVEAGLWHREAVAAWLGSPHRDQCMRVLIELPDGLDEEQTVEQARLLYRLVQQGVLQRRSPSVPVLLHGEGSSCWPALRLAVSQALDIRIGLEDILTMPDGSPAPGNAALVAAAQLIAATGPAEVAGSADQPR
jgi:uncharacterized protein (DUF849 family)